MGLKMKKIKDNDFLMELRDLLLKHNASIRFDCGDASDLHGVYDERIVVKVGDDDLLDVDGFWLCGADFKVGNLCK